MSKAEQPNIVVFFSDQQRWDTLGCYGQRLDITPHLDAMAAEGVRFDRAFSVQPVCGPARACLQTGKYASQLGCFTNHRRMPLTERTLGHFLSEAGYETGYIGKLHLASDWPRDGRESYGDRAIPAELRFGYNDYWLVAETLEFTSHSYDGFMYDGDGNKRFFPEGRYRADAQTDWVLEYLESCRDDRPFFLFDSYVEPHHQNDHNHFEGPCGSKQKYANFEPPGDLVNSHGDWREEMPDYLGCCGSLDYNLGRVRAKLAQLGLADHTVIIYFSDHGCHFRTRNSEYKRSCHESSIRVPLVIYGPGFTGGKVVDSMVNTVDVTATILHAAGIDLPVYVQGRPVQQLLDGDCADWPGEVFVQIGESQVGRAIRTDRWKYSVYAPDKDPGVDGGSDVYVEQYLYDLENDPHEQNNLVSDAAYKDVRAELAGVLLRYMEIAEEPWAEIRTE
ncbi:MAG: sulfatase-like hydrolase/transferase [Sedimentisphaerales bacterium]|nr:sulfatase-like hydrolase/transferase [Sedimentisphaerales bacterium]